MTTLMDKIQKTKKVKPRKTLLYGVHGIGKSSWAAKWPNPVFINIENGLSDLDVDAFPIPQDLQQAWAPILELSTTEQPHGYKTLVIDSIDWLERMIHQQVIKEHDKQIRSISEIPYGKGFDAAAAFFSKLMNSLDSVVENGMHVLLLAHSSIQRFESPTSESYDRYAPKLHVNSKGVGVGALVQEFCDEVLFCNYKVYTTSKEEGFNRKRAVATGGGDRVIYTTERPSHLAKNRLGLPDEIPMTRDGFEYGQYLEVTE